MSNTDNIKIRISGGSGVGKTQIARIYINFEFNKHHESTIGVDFFKKDIVINNKPYMIPVIIFEFAGGEKYQELFLLPKYNENFFGHIFVYDVTSYNSFNYIKQLIEKYKKIVETNCIMIIVGNKSDLDMKREVTYEEGYLLAEELNYIFFETSAKANFNIDALFSCIIYKICKMMKSNINQVNCEIIKQSKNCCFIL